MPRSIRIKPKHELSCRYCSDRHYPALTARACSERYGVAQLPVSPSRLHWTEQHWVLVVHRPSGTHAFDTQMPLATAHFPEQHCGSVAQRPSPSWMQVPPPASSSGAGETSDEPRQSVGWLMT